MDGYESMPVTEAAQEVQRSGFPEAYADHEQDARVLASALTGNSRAAFWCTVDDDRDEDSPDLDDAGLTERAAAVRADLARTFGELPLGGFAPGGVRDGHMEGSAHYEGRAIDVFVRPVSTDNKRRGWAIAGYLVAPGRPARHQHRDLRRPGLAGRQLRATGGRTTACRAARQGDRRILEHRDHVHVDVAR